MHLRVQGSHSPWESLKVFEFEIQVQGPWKSMKIVVGAGKSLNFNANFIIIIKLALKLLWSSI